MGVDREREWVGALNRELNRALTKRNEEVVALVDALRRIAAPNYAARSAEERRMAAIARESLAKYGRDAR